MPLSNLVSQNYGRLIGLFPEDEPDAPGAPPTATGIKDFKVSKLAALWTISVEGPATYQVYVQPIGTDYWRKVDAGLIDGTASGDVVNIGGSVQGIRIDPLADVNPYQVSVVGKF